MTGTYDLRTSHYDHPEAKRGQQLNGHSNIFVRRPDGPWYRVRYDARHKVRLLIAMRGFNDFVATHCDLVPSEPTQ